MSIPSILIPADFTILKNFNPPLAAEDFTRRGFFHAFFMFQLLVTGYAVRNATPGFKADKIGILCGPDPQEREFSHLK